MTVLVTGGAGYVGSHTVLTLLDAGYDVVIADNLSNSKREAVERVAELAHRSPALEAIDLCDSEAVGALFQKHTFGAVMHFAGLKAVGESVAQPLLYYRNNLFSTVNLLSSMARFGVRRLVFSSSATVYGSPESVPISEDAPLHATNPYGQTKLMQEQIIRDVCAADPGFHAALLRYFNPVGAHPSGRIGEDPFGAPNNLMPYIAQVAVGRLSRLAVYGNDYPTRDGTGVRDYIHVMDLAEGHVAALKKLESGCGLVTYNLGTGKSCSVLEMVAAFEKASGRKVPYLIAPRRAGDIAACYADCSRAESELGWKARRSLDEMCRDAWNWQSQNPNGYEGDDGI